MLNRDDALKMIQNVYEARVRGDRESLARYWADGAHFEIVGDRSLLQGVAMSAPRPMEAISSLIDQFQFDELELLDAIVEGKNVAVRWQVKVTVAGQDPVTTQLFDRIQLDEDGKILSFVQFADTALVRYLTCGDVRAADAAVS